MRNSTFFKMLLLAAALLTGGRVWADDETLNCPKGTIINNTMTFTTTNFTIVHSKGSDSNFAEYTPWRVYTNNTVKFSAGPNVETITKVEITATTSSYASAVFGGGSSITINQGNGSVSTSVSNTIATITMTGTVTEFTLKPSAQTRWSSITIYFTPTSDCSPSNLSFSENTITKSIVEEEYTQTATSLNETTAITYSSSKPSIASVNGSGKVTFNGLGTTTITASQEAGTHNGTDYCAATTSYTLTIENISAPAAIAATNVSTTGFTANWNAVSGASEYKLDVYYGSVFLDEDFSSITTGDNTTTTGSSSSWVGNTNFPTVSTAYQAGGAVRIGKSDGVGSITSKTIDLSSGATLSFDVKGWTTVEGDIKVSVDGGTAQTVTYTAKMTDAFETKTVTLASATATSTVKIETSAKRAFLDNIKISNKVFVENYENLTVNSISKNVTGLTPNTKYAYTVKAKNDSYESASSNEIEVTTGKSVTSAQTGNWSATDTWSSNAVPESKDAITIGGGHTITQDANDASCSALTIQTEGKLIVSSGKHLTVSGSITNQAGNGGLLLESDATGTASLIHSNAGVQATAERYLKGGWTAADGGWHLISSPVAAQAITAFTTDGENNGYDFYGWNEPTNTWMNQKDGGFNAWNGGGNFVVGRGYMVSYQQNQTLSFTGALNTSDVNISGLTKSGNTYSGWHLLGNPYASAIRWNADEDEMVLDKLNANAKIWHEGNKSYSDIAPNGIIPSAQGFMVQATAGNAGIIIDSAARVHDNQAFYKNGSGNMVLLVAAEASGASAQESKLLLNSAATAGFDAYYDALFLAGYAPQFFSVSDNEQLSTNAMPDFDDKVIPFGFVKNQADQYIIRLHESPAGMMLKLTDKKTGTVTNLSEHNSYAFSAEEGDDVMRFELEMNALGIGESPKTSTVRLYAYNGYVYLSGLAAPTNFVMTDIAGRVVMTKHFNNTGQASLNTGKLPKGVYVVTAITGGQVVSAKVVL